MTILNNKIEKYFVSRSFLRYLSGVVGGKRCVLFGQSRLGSVCCLVASGGDAVRCDGGAHDRSDVFDW